MDSDKTESGNISPDRHGPFGVREESVPPSSPAEPVRSAQSDDPTTPNSNTSSPESYEPTREDLALRERIVQAMKTVYDPEIPVNIYDLGMVYEIEVQGASKVLVTMTLTSPACPVAGTLPGEVEEKVNEVEGVREGKVELVWDPPWTPDRMSESAKLELGMF
ncbi:MAG: SUF system Fe-S cluster assembly protein [Candidatus Eisenbacteria bacterium]|uniref:SUF system Fe-S cluster assembly protein n=1 Tax=Eiseniibacteriota bacterium TaxID=2212470 RepID=A0A956SDW9_UNCEI|nr:SUF system Fe-S cluster assembly protein [Candidatus Eisenbacteria bacterium]